MNQPTIATPAAPANPAPAPAAVEPARPTSSSRAAALKEKLEASESVAEGQPSSSSPPEPSAADSGATTETAPPDAEAAAARQQRAERLQRIQQLRAKEEAARQQRAERQRAKPSQPSVDAAEFERLRKRVAELEPHEAVFKSEESLLEAAEKQGLSSQKIVEWMKKRLNDPAAVAKQHAQTETNAVRDELKQLREQIDADRKAFEAQRKAEVAERQQYSMTSQFMSDIAAKEKTHPRVARAKAKLGDNIVHLANHLVARDLPEGYGVEELHDHLEQFFDAIEAFGGTQSAPIAQPPTANNPDSKESAITLNGRTAAGRESLVEAKPLHQLTKAERIARARAKLERD